MPAPRRLGLRLGSRTPHLTPRPVSATLAAAVPPPDSDLHGAACAELDTDLFYGPDEEDPAYQDVVGREFAERRAKAICWSCPVRGACLALAVRRPEPEGIWGGLTARERRRLIGDLRMKRTTLDQAVAR
ncbi:WhiB family transcriptional regulator [Kitasatospora sp. NPDC008050]|uniref:WhiB family transcriptional regulator n=1 Tax=Kitasatospora sp. NPDC008050 TaxID=3364021 RepID=UPI0036EA7768